MKKWLLLRGLAREQRHWHEFPTLFEEAQPGTQVHCIDLPGAGTEHRRLSPASIQEIMTDVRERWLELRSEDDDWSCLAISMGGMIALEWCNRHPGDFRKLALVNSSTASLSPVFHRLRVTNLPKALGILFQGDAVAREKVILELTTHLIPGRINEMAQAWAKVSAESPMSRRTILTQLLAASRYQLDKKPRLPMAVFTSAKDRFTDPQCSHALAKYLDVPITIHPSAGHDLPLDDPHWLTREILNWSRSNP